MNLKQRFDELCADIKKKLPEDNVQGIMPTVSEIRYFAMKNSVAIPKVTTWAELEKEPDYYTLALRKARSLGAVGSPIFYSRLYNRIELGFPDNSYIFTEQGLK